MKKNIKQIVSIVLLFLVPVVISLAQPLPGGNPEGVNQPVSCPINDGHWILLGLIMIYGIKQVWKNIRFSKDEKLV